MAAFLVTVKLPKNPSHNPRAKVTGHCPVNGNDCTDVTGEHHTVLAHAPDLDTVREIWKGSGYHVTRIEAVE